MLLNTQTGFSYSLLIVPIIGLMWPQLLSFSGLLSWLVVFLLIISLVAVYLFFNKRIFLLVIIFMLCSVYSVNYAVRLSASLLKEGVSSATVTGFISDIPKQYDSFGRAKQNFTLNLVTKDQSLKDSCQWPNRKIRVQWQTERVLIPGELITLTLAVKPLSSLQNPYGVDFRRKQIIQGFCAKAKVLSVGDTHYLGVTLFASLFSRTLASFRYVVFQSLDQRLQGLSQQGLIKALIVGDKGAISAAQWDLFAATGTSHLAVISGLHIGIVAMLAIFLSRCALFFLSGEIKRTAAIVMVLIACFTYAALAGFSLPTLRACIMLSLVMGARFFKRHIPIAWLFLTCLLLSLLLNPVACLSESFYLSFGAVFIILWVSLGWKDRGQALKWLRPQMAVSLLLVPVLILVFGRAALHSFFINLYAVPLFSFIVVPALLFLAGVELVLSIIFSSSYLMPLWKIINGVLSFFISSLSFSQALLPQLQLPSFSLKECIALSSLLLLLMLPKPLKPPYLLGLIPLLLLMPVKPTIKASEAVVTVFDVGQGLAILVETQQHVLAYDFGIAAASEEQLSNYVFTVMPYLRKQGYNRIDMAVISHDDNDHNGGYDYLRRSLHINQLLVGEKSQQGGRSCHQHFKWQWDGVDFEIFPLLFKPSNGLHKRVGNNASCVLRVSIGESSVLVPGDIERFSEFYLAKHYGARLKSTVLVVPHHGSQTSSTWPFLRVVSPQTAIVSAAKNSRFGHPHRSVVNRFRKMNIDLKNTADEGAVRVRLNAKAIMYERNNVISKHYWD